MFTNPRLSLTVLPALLGAVMSFTFAGSFTSSGGATVVISTSSTDPGEGLPTPEEVLSECLMKLDMIVAQANEDIVDETAYTVGEIEYLRDSGSSEKKIKKEASNGRKRVQSIARSALADINRVNGDCLINLIRRGADRGMLSDLSRAVKLSVRDLKVATQDAYEVINDARDG